MGPHIFGGLNAAEVLGGQDHRHAQQRPDSGDGPEQGRLLIVFRLLAHLGGQHLDLLSYGGQQFGVESRGLAGAVGANSQTVQGQRPE